MARINLGILGGFSGKVGNVVGGAWKGIDYMRAKASSVANPRTVGQMNQRTRFSTILGFLKPITPFLRVGFKLFAVKQTAFNSAMSYNLANAIIGEYPDISVDLTSALVSRGNLTPIANADATIQDGTAQITWDDNTGSGSAKANDKLLLVVYNSMKGEATFETAGPDRSAGTFEIPLPANWVGDDVDVYAGFISFDGKEVANSVYLGQKTVA